MNDSLEDPRPQSTERENAYSIDAERSYNGPIPTAALKIDVLYLELRNTPTVSRLENECILIFEEIEET